jgi:hypothetical protein
VNYYTKAINLARHLPEAERVYYSTEATTLKNRILLPGVPAGN